VTKIEKAKFRIRMAKTRARQPFGLVFAIKQVFIERCYV